MKKSLRIFILLIFWVPVVSAQSLDPFYQSVVSQVSYDSVLSYLEKHESLGVKDPGSQELSDAGMWLYQKYLDYGYTVQRDSFNFFGSTYFNVVATKTGTLYPDTYVIVGAHYDSKSGPGTNDNGSGTAILLETARALKDVSTRYSLRFIAFTVEEIGLLGSRHYVDDIAVPASQQIRIMFNIDEAGGIGGELNDTITCEEDQSGNPSSNNAISSLYTDTLENLTYLYSSLGVKRAAAYSSDYIPFEDAGYYITGYYETNESSFPHSGNDLLANLDTSYVFEIARAATGATLYFAQAYDPGVFAIWQPVPSAVMYPNPASGWITISSSVAVSRAELCNATGQIVFVSEFPGDQTFRMDLSLLPSGIYTLLLTDKTGVTRSSGKVIRQ